ncbi:phosphotransferase family protein [Caulobacter mirabilis]|uniref:Phosphotransferase family protein n=1 Tax=Caulobacter mirabilis TaxID=69666 RepID=A0A2D2AXT4_9CAUL|nr:phosphotransferase family protein [Caulobacter mirabilis]ATQ42828.1 phosphotransferase family protein [Caulobacter mirabilis]
MSDLESALNAVAGQLGGRSVTDLRRLSGGASQETWAFALDSGRPLILRRKPAGSDSPTGGQVTLAMEAALIQAAAKQGAPVPEVLYVSAPGSDIGEAYVMGRVEGETLGKRIAVGEAFVAVRPKLAFQCGQVLAQIHSIPLEGLPDLNRSSALGELDRFEDSYRRIGAKRPIFETAFRWLRERAPDLPEPVLVHGDFRNGNIMFQPDVGVAAVLDWELIHIGDPAEDMGWLCTASWRFSGRKPVGGFGDYEDLLAGYEAGGGTPIPLERVLYWQMLGSLKWGVMCLGMYTSFATGVDPSIERAMIGRRTSECEIDLMALLERAR